MDKINIQYYGRLKRPATCVLSKYMLMIYLHASFSEGLTQRSAARVIEKQYPYYFN